MAKSLRSKWRRKCRAVKRIKYGEKELSVLKKTLGIDESNQNAESSKIAMIGQVVEKKKLKRKSDDTSSLSTTEKPSAMETDMTRSFNPKTMRDKNGTHPVWVHQRKIKQNRMASKAIKKKKANRKR